MVRDWQGALVLHNVTENVTFIFQHTGKHVMGLVYARVVLPKSEEKGIVIFHFHGYMGHCWDWTDMLAFFTVAGYGVVSMDVCKQSGYSQDGFAFSSRKYS